jgi:hypothetical protein
MRVPSFFLVGCLGIVSTVIVGCGSTGAGDPETLDAQVATPEGARAAIAHDPWTLIRASEALRARLSEPRAIRRVGERFEPESAAPKAGWQPLGGAPKVSFPPDADGATRIAASDDVWIELTPEGARGVEADASTGALIYRELEPAVDAVHVVTRERAEELRVFHAPGATLRATWRIATGPGVREVRPREGIVEVLDAQGRVRLATEKGFAVDEAGEKRDVEITIAGATMSARVDARGMRGEVVLDPSWTRINKNGVGALWAFPIGGARTLLLDTGVAAIYDASTDSWYSAPLPSGDFNYEFFTQFADGVVLNVSSKTPSAETYDPSTNTWTAISPPPLPRPHAMKPARLSATKILFTGGVNGSGSATTQAIVLDEATGAWTTKAPMSTARYAHGATPLKDGRVLVVGGLSASGASLSSAEIYDPTSNSWSAAPSLPEASIAAATLLADGRAFVTTGGTSAYAFDPTGAGSWTTLAMPTQATGVDPGAPGLFNAQLPSGGVLLVQTGAQTNALRFNPKTNDWTVLPPSPTPACGAQFAVIADGRAVGSPRCDSGIEIFTEGAPNGTTCGNDAACAFGHCVDGVCCDTACTLQCQACNVAGKIGTCSLVTGAPVGTRAACPGSGTCRATCDGTSGFCNYPTSSKPCGTTACTSGSATVAGTCNGAGTCNAPAPTPCAPYACGASACKTTCSAHSDCDAAAYCDAGNAKCVAKKSNGSSCAGAFECTSSVCADGVCCDKACAGTCEACDATGICKPVTGAPKAGHGSCAGSGACAGSCGGTSSSCAYPGSATSCGTASCAGGVATLLSSCDGAGACATSATKTCAPYVCGAVGCKISCGNDGDCVSGYVCSSGACVTAPPPDAGPPDTGAIDTGIFDTGTSDTALPDTSTPDTALPDTATPDTTPVYEAAPPDDASPPPISGSFKTCTGASDCASGFCVDGVCCDSACKEACHSCALPTAPGKCTVVPVGTDPRGSCGNPGNCAATCGVGGVCVPTNGGSQCAPAKCTSPTLGIAASYCSGGAASTCPVATTAFDCTPYLCEPAFGACRGQCADSTQCAAGFICETTSGKCVAAPPGDAGGDGGGCAVEAGRGAGEGGGIAIALLAWGGLVARRRRSRMVAR